MTIAVYNTLVDLPAPISATEGDIAYVKETGETKLFADLSALSSYSYLFDGFSYLSIDSSKISYLSNNLNDSFNIAFFGYSTDSPSGGSFLSFYLDSNVSFIVDGSAVPAPLTLSDSIAAYSFTPLDTVNNPEANAASIHFPGTNSSIISAANQSLVNFTQEFLPYTMEAWTRTLKTPADNQTIADIPGCLRWSNDGIIFNDVNFTFSTPPGNFIHNTWEHNALSYDGWDHKYFYNGLEKTLNIDADYEKAAGELVFEDFLTDRGAAFQAKVFFPSIPQDATLFTLGNVGNQTNLTLSNASTTPILTLTKDALSVSTTTIPTDSDYHVVSWIYDNDAGSIKLLIDNNLVGTDTAGSSFSTWAGGGNTEYISEYSISPGDVTHQPIHWHSSAANYETLRDATTITPSGNLRMNTTRNDYYSYFVLTGSPKIVSNLNTIYYFESKWVGPERQASSSTDAYPYSNMGIHLVDAGWDGYETTTKDTPYTANSWKGTYLTNSSLRPSSSSGIYKTPLMYTLSGYNNHRYNGIYSYYLDTRNNIIVVIKNGSSVIRNFSNAFGSFGYPIDGSGFRLAFQNWNLDRYHVKPYDPDNNIEIVFNKNDWQFDPLELYRAHAGTIGITIPADGAFLESPNFQNWPKPGSTYQHKLRYYPKKVEKFETKPITVGSGEKDLNPENETGLSYANSYIANTGGSIITHSDSDLTTLITGSTISDGDVLLLNPGTYSVTSIPDPTYGASGNGTYNLWGGKSFLICGNTSNPNDVEINYTPTTTQRDKPIFGRTQKSIAGLSFLKFKRKYISGVITNYAQAISNFSNGFTCYKTIFDFDNTKFAFSYDNQYRPGNKVFNKCLFTNYNGEVYPDYRGIYSTIKLTDCAFSDQYDASSSFGHTKKGLIEKYVKNNNSGSNFSITKDNFNGYMKNFHLRSLQAYDSSFSVTDSTQKSAIYSSNVNGLNTELLIQSTSESPTILDVDTKGNLLHNNNLVYEGSISKQDWVYHRLKLNNNNLEYYNDNSLVHTINNFLVSYKSISDMDIFIGNRKVFNELTSTFIDEPVEGNTLIKDFRLADSIGTSIPTSDHNRNSSDRVFTANSQAVPSNTDVNIIGSGISSINFAPIEGLNKNWFTIGVGIPDTVSAIKSTSVVTHVPKIGGSYDIIESLYDSDLSLFDSGNDYKILLDFVNIDDSNQPIKWKYNIIQPRTRISVGYDSTETSFLIKKFRNAELLNYYDSAGNYQASISFYPEKVNNNDSYDPVFFNLAGSEDKKSINSIELMFDKFGADIMANSQFDLRLVTINRLDSISETPYTFDTELSSFAIYDSLGALP